MLVALNLEERAYRTPAEVAQTWRDMTDLQTEAT